MFEMVKREKSWAAAAAFALLVTMFPLSAMAASGPVTFKMVVSAGARTCLPNATATVKITPTGPVEIMDVAVSGLPPNTDFDFFVIQIPVSPFGIAWYQGDIETDETGSGHQRFIGRFSIETFSVAVGVAPAPIVFNSGQFPNANMNPPFMPIQMYHLGLWFNSRDDARKNGCPDGVTPFNGEHDAGIQVLNTSNFPNLDGPLRNVQ